MEGPLLFVLGVIGHWSLVIGHWSFVLGHLSFVIGPWGIGHWGTYKGIFFTFMVINLRLI